MLPALRMGRTTAAWLPGVELARMAALFDVAPGLLYKDPNLFVGRGGKLPPDPSRGVHPLIPG